MVSPRDGIEQSLQKSALSPNVLAQKQSPLKKAVIDIKLKESVTDSQKKNTDYRLLDIPKSSLNLWSENQ